MGKKEKIFPLNTAGGKIRELRKKNGLSRSQLYDLVYEVSGCDYRAGSDSSKEKTVYNWESGKTQLNYETMIAICKTLKCSSDYLLGLDECTNKTVQFIHEKTGLSEDAITELQKRSKNNSSPRELFTLSIILGEQFEILSDIADYFLFPDNVQTKFHINTVTGTLEPKESFIYNSGEIILEQANQNIPIDSKVLRNAMLNAITEKLILFKGHYFIDRDEKAKRTVLKAPDTN